MASPVPTNAFFGADDGMVRPYKWFHTKKNSQLFLMISDEVKLSIKIVENDEI